MKKIVLMFVAAGMPASCNEEFPGFLKTGGRYIVNGKGKHVFMRGTGPGGWMPGELYLLITFS